jgi:TolB-like protein
MFRKRNLLIILFALFELHTVFSQSVLIDTALSNATKEITESVPHGSIIAVLNISSEYANLSDYIINELIFNLVNSRLFQVVPRSMVEFEAARREFSFQMSGDVSDDSQKRLGQFLGADSIITGTVIRDSESTYRLTINTINLENFIIQSSYRASIQNDRQVRTLISNSVGSFYDDYTTGERLLMGLGNSFFGIGSTINGHQGGGVIRALEIVGSCFVIGGLVNRGIFYDDEEMYGMANALLYTGSGLIGAGVAVGFIIPFFHHKQSSAAIAAVEDDFPFNLGLVSSNGRDINGLRISYNMRF